MARIGMVVGELRGLLGDSVGDRLAAIADIHAVEPAKGVEAASAVAVDDVDAFAAGDDAVRGLARAACWAIWVEGWKKWSRSRHSVRCRRKRVCRACWSPFDRRLNGSGLERVQVRSRQTYLRSGEGLAPVARAFTAEPDC